MVYFLLQKTWKEYYLNFSSALIKMVWNMKCWNIHRKDKYLVLLLIISNILNLISDTMSYSKPEQMNDQEFYISVLQVKCLSKGDTRSFRVISSRLIEWLPMMAFYVWQFFWCFDHPSELFKTFLGQFYNKKITPLFLLFL